MPEPLQNHQPVLQQIAQTDSWPEDASWPSIRDEIKAALSKNISVFLSQTATSSPPSSAAPPGNYRIPPFPPRRGNHPAPQPIPLSHMSDEQAEEFKSTLFTLLDEFDAGPPFTIQRICELCLFPQSHYKTLGKYFRAVERALLVTGTWDEYRPPPSSVREEIDPSGQKRFIPISSTSTSVPSTPLFSPIPFLHEDARRSRSVSPPPSPLVLSAIGPSSGGHPESLDIQPLGLVDEMDDPRPGHLSEHPIAISSTTNIPSEPPSLESRFVSSSQNDEQPDDAMDEDKENKG